MNRETLQELLQRQPFEPFELRLTNGEKHQVRHPETALLLKSRLILGIPDSDRTVICSLLHIAAVEILQSA